MIVTRKSLARRTFLRGIGTTLALPFLDAMVPAFGATTANAKPAVRLAFVYVPNGIIMKYWTPAAEGSGYIVMLCNRLAAMLSDLLLFDAQHVDEGPIATIHLPLRLRPGLHGNWHPAPRS